MSCRRDTARALRGWLRWAVACAVAACVVSGCSSSESSGAAERERAALAAAALRYAPQIDLAAGERWLPMGGREFVDHSDLVWLGPCGPDRLAVGRSIDSPGILRYPVLTPARLGGHPRPLTVPLRRLPACRFDHDRLLKTTDYTRPYDVERADDIAIDEGFFIDLADHARRGHHPDKRVPAYYEISRERLRGVPVLRIDYWLLFGRDVPPLPRAVRTQFTREGDWERAAVLLRPVADDRYRPLAVRIYSGGRDAHREREWRSVPRVSDGHGAEATHPVIYSARGTHSLFDAPGRYPYTLRLTGENGGKFTGTEVASACPRCIRWRTWRLLRNARAEPWYGYGGAWGNARGVGSTGGPLGPSSYVHLTNEPAQTGSPNP